MDPRGKTNPKVKRKESSISSLSGIDPGQFGLGERLDQQLHSNYSEISFGRASILSKELIKSMVSSELKPSTVKVTEKKVIVWTPVVIEKDFPQYVEPKKLEYKGGEALFKHQYPSYLKDVVGGMIIRMPQTEIKDFLAEFIDVNQLPGDEQLLNYLESQNSQWRNQRLQSAQENRSNQQTLEADLTTILQTEIIRDLDISSRTIVASRLKEVLDRTSSKATIQQRIKNKTIELQNLQPGNSLMKKREAKLLAKKQIILEKYFKDQHKPKQISKDLKVPIDLVYRTVKDGKKLANSCLEQVGESQPLRGVQNHSIDLVGNLQNVMNSSSGISKFGGNNILQIHATNVDPHDPNHGIVSMGQQVHSQKFMKYNDPRLLNKIQEYFENHGIYTFTLAKLRTHLASTMSQQFVPSESTLSKTLQEIFHLKYGPLQQANVKYRDPTFNEKRLWVSRLLAQFMSENVVIISVDESNFRADALPSKQWAFKPQQSILRKRQSQLAFHSNANHIDTTEKSTNTMVQTQIKNVFKYHDQLFTYTPHTPTISIPQLLELELQGLQQQSLPRTIVEAGQVATPAIVQNYELQSNIEQSLDQSSSQNSNNPLPKRGRGRPKGSFSQKTILRLQQERQSQEAAQSIVIAPSPKQKSLISNKVEIKESSRYQRMVIKGNRPGDQRLQSKPQISQAFYQILIDFSEIKTLEESKSQGSQKQINKTNNNYGLNPPATPRNLKVQGVLKPQSTAISQPAMNRIQLARSNSSPALMKSPKLQSQSKTTDAQTFNNNQGPKTKTKPIASSLQTIVEEVKQEPTIGQSMLASYRKHPQRLELTPILEDLAELCLSSNVKKYRDDTLLHSSSHKKQRLLTDIQIAARAEQEGVRKQLDMLFLGENTPIKQKGKYRTIGSKQVGGKILWFWLFMDYGYFRPHGIQSSNSSTTTSIELSQLIDLQAIVSLWFGRLDINSDENSISGFYTRRYGLLQFWKQLCEGKIPWC